MNVIGLCGSLRQASVNRRLLQLAGEVMPPGMQLTIEPWDLTPPFNAELLAQRLPPMVADLRQRIRSADALLIATPEYNFSVPGMFKNLLDWLSLGEDQPLNRKPVAILSASPGALGGARAQ